MKLTKNSGAGFARNRGLETARGKYVFFMDSDDLLLNTALKEMYNAAEMFDADVVYCEKYLMSEGIGEKFKSNIHLANYLIQSGGFVQKPTNVKYDLKFRIEEWLKNRFWMTPWLRLSSRDFLIENNIKFQTIHHQNDNGWAFFELCLAKKFVRIPNICYVRRMRGDSLSGSQKTVDVYLYRWLEKTVSGIKDIDNFMGKTEFFSEHPEYRYAVLNKWATDDLQNALNACQNLPPHIVMKILKNIFKNEFGEHDILFSYLLTNSLVLGSNLIFANQKIHELSGKLNGLK